MRNSKQFLSALPKTPGVYQMINQHGAVIYVGKAKNLKARLTSYFSNQTKDTKTASLMKSVVDITITVTESEKDAVLLECTLIKKHLPKYNILLRDDKSYPYILLSDHPYPRLELYRGARKKNGQLFGPYPNAGTVRETIKLLQKLFRLRTCSDHYFVYGKIPCLLYQLKRCTAPCVDYISEEEYRLSVNDAALFLEGKNEMVVNALLARMEKASENLHYEKAAFYRDQINRLRQLQDKQPIFSNSPSVDIIGIASTSGIVVIQLLIVRNGQLIGSEAYYPKLPPFWELSDVLHAFISQHYLNRLSSVDFMPSQLLLPIVLDDQSILELTLTAIAEKTVSIQVPKLGVKKKWLMMATKNAEESLSLYLSTKANMAGRFKELENVLDLKEPLKRIECFDISHTQGEATVGSCVAFDHSGPLKADYRRYNIRSAIKSDDLSAMKEIFSRRYKYLHENQEKKPDLIIVDGGKLQLQIAKTVLDELKVTDIPIIGVSKGKGRKAGFETIHEIQKPSYRLPPHSIALHLIQHIRDEAHRFAITGHRQRRNKARVHSVLETIHGIGSKRRRDLLRYFGGIQGLSRASLERLMEVPGIDLVLAERIYAALHDATL